MVLEKLKGILVDQLDVSEDIITPESQVIQDLGADSLDVVDLVMAIEEEFEISIPDDKIEDMKTVGDMVKYIEENSSNA